jgi:hypothetical protein
MFYVVEVTGCWDGETGTAPRVLWAKKPNFNNGEIRYY